MRRSKFLKIKRSISTTLRSLSLFALLSFFASCSPQVNQAQHTVSLTQDFEDGDIFLASHHKPLVILDAGHGGNDYGTRYQTFCEKSVALSTTMMAKKHLEKLGFTVFLTRSRDVFIPLKERVALANVQQEPIFVSIHFNAAKNVRAHGIEVYYYDQKQGSRAIASRQLADLVLFHMLDETKAKSRGVKGGNFHVIRETKMPAILVEGGFITNTSERALLSCRSYLDKIARGIAEGVKHYVENRPRRDSNARPAA